MDAGAPDTDTPPTERQSLAQHAGAALARLRPGVGGWRVAALTGALIATGPVLTILGANLLAARSERETTQLRDRLAPRIAAERAANEARAMLAGAVRRPTLGQTVEALARVLPADAQVARAARTTGGALELDVAAADPDALRTAIRRAPQFTELRDASQRRTDSGMIVSLRGATK